MSTPWEPRFSDWRECKVEMSCGEVATQSNSRNEYGVMMMTPDTPYEGDGAIFWIDAMHLYLRYNWETWHKVSTDDPENCEQICKRSSAKLLLYTSTSIKHHSIHVYHIEKLPEELFGKPKPPPEEEDSLAEDDEPDAKKGEKSADENAEKDTAQPDGKDEKFVSELIADLCGVPIAHVNFMSTRLDFYELSGEIIFISYFRQTGNWLADEESLDDDEAPIWYGTHEVTPSPLEIAKRVRERLRGVIPENVPFHTLVMLRERCIIVNEAEHIPIWKRENVTFVRRKEVEYSRVDALDEVLLLMPGAKMAGLDKLGPKIEKALLELPPLQ